MSRSFTKLFSSITESTVWCKSLSTRIVWITMLAMADREGRVWASIPGLANRARVTVAETEAALECFLAPDRYSRTPDHKGCRIKNIDGGWQLLNYLKYRNMRDEETRKEQNRDSQRRRRGRLHASNNVSNIADSQPRSAQAEAEADVQVVSTLKRDDVVVNTGKASADYSPVPIGTCGGASAPHDPVRPVVHTCPHLEIIALYAKHLPMGRQVRVELWNGARANRLQARWRELQEHQSLDWWEKFFAYCARSPFLTGKASSLGRPPFLISLDWLIKPENFTKVIEGAYDERRAD